MTSAAPISFDHQKLNLSDYIDTPFIKGYSVAVDVVVVITLVLTPFYYYIIPKKSLSSMKTPQKFLLVYTTYTLFTILSYAFCKHGFISPLATTFSIGWIPNLPEWLQISCYIITHTAGGISTDFLLIALFHRYFYVSKVVYNSRKGTEGSVLKQGSPLTPAFGSKKDVPLVPLIPRITYCDYHFVTFGNDHVLTYRCYLDAQWFERTAIITWFMLIFISICNLLNVIFWLLWALKMSNENNRKNWVMKKWLNDDDFLPVELEFAERFAAQFKMGNLLIFYFIEAHTEYTLFLHIDKLILQILLTKGGRIENSSIFPMKQNSLPPLRRAS